MIVDRRKKNFANLGDIQAGEGFIFEDKFYMVIERDCVEVNFEDVPVMNLDDGGYEELDKDTPVERCRYEINVFD